MLSLRFGSVYLCVFWYMEKKICCCYKKIEQLACRSFFGDISPDRAIVETRKCSKECLVRRTIFTRLTFMVEDDLNQITLPSNVLTVHCRCVYAGLGVYSNPSPPQNEVDSTSLSNLEEVARSKHVLKFYLSGVKPSY